MKRHAGRGAPEQSGGPRTDADLLRIADQDPAAFRELYERYAEVVFGFFLRRTADRETALDLTAETFAQAWQWRGRFEDRRHGSVGPWLIGISRHLLFRCVRGRRVIADACERLKITSGRTAIAPSDAWIDGLEEDLLSALHALPVSQRRAIELRVLRDLPYQAVAQELECSPTAARIRVSRGLTSLRGSIPPTTAQEQPA